MKEPKVLTRMRLCECWGDSLSIEELKEVNNYIENLQRENQKLKEKIKKIVEYAYGTDMLVIEYEQLCKIAEVE